MWSWRKVGRATCLYTGYLMGHLYFFLYSKSSLRDIYLGNVTLCPLNRIEYNSIHFSLRPVLMLKSELSDSQKARP